MKKVADSLRIIDNDSDKEKVMCRSTAYKSSCMDGVYEHNGEFYQYLISDYTFHYFEKIVKPLDIGLAIGDEDE